MAKAQVENQPIKTAPSVEMLIQRQQALKTLQHEANSIETLIAEQQNIVSAANTQSDTTAELRKQRSLLLADGATGSDVSAQLSEIDKAIAGATKGYQADCEAKEQAVKMAADMMEGLQMKLENIHQLIAEETRAVIALQQDFLRQIAIDESKRYQAAADQLAESIKTIIAIDSLLKKSCGKPSGVITSPGLISVVPVGDMPKKRMGFYFQQHTKARLMPNDMTGIVSRLTDLGIELIQ